MEKLRSIIKNKLSHSGFIKYLKNTTWILFSRIISLGVSFFTTIYLIRYLGPNNYGMLAFSVSFVGLFSFISNLGIDQVLLRELSKDPHRKDELLGTSLLLKLVASAFSILLIILIISFTTNDSLTLLLIIINSFGLLFGSLNVLSYYFQSRVEAKYNAVSLILVTLILNSLKIAAIFYNKGIIYFSLILLSENIFYGVIGIYFYIKRGNKIFNLNFKKTIAYSMLKDSWPLMLSSAFILIYTRIDQVMLKYMTNIFNVGVYDAAVRISEIWYFIPSLIVSSIFPAIINAKKVSDGLFKERMIKLYSLLLYTALSVALIINIFAPYIINIIYGAKFIEASGVLTVYVWAGIPVFLTIAMNAYLLAENKTKTLFLSSFVGMLLNIPLNLLLIPKYGIYGATIATLISYSSIPIYIFIAKDTREQFNLVKMALIYPLRYLYRNDIRN